MVETLTPAVCGGRHRQAIAIGLFTLASVAAAAAVGAVLGWVGGLLGPRTVLLSVAGVVALVAAMREAGMLRIGVPDLKRQVPEHWRRSLPLPVWTTGYGAILGSGFGTFQPAATYWATLTTVTAMGRPAAGAACLGLFGLARGVMVVVPGAGLLGRFAGAFRLIRPVNAVVLAVMAAACVPAVANAQAVPTRVGTSDPSLSLGNLAYTRWVNGVPQVEIKTPAGELFTFPGGRTPAISGSRMAYVDANGIRLVEWRTGRQLKRIAGSTASKPALSGPWFAWVRTGTLTQRLQVLNLDSGRLRTIVKISIDTDLGRPALSGKVLAWHQMDGGGHIIRKTWIGLGTYATVITGRRRYQYRDPALGWGRTAWIASDAETTSVWVKNAKGVTKRVATTFGPDFIYTNVAIGQKRIIVSRWGLLTGQAALDIIPLIGV